MVSRRNIKFLKHLKKKGVIFIDINSVYIDETAYIERGAIIYPFTVIIGKSTIKSGAKIMPYSYISDCVIGENTLIYSSQLEEAIIGNNVKIGPNAHIRPDTVIEDDCRIGNFVEIKNSLIGLGTKIAHLTYIGDTKVGTNCNFGCGVVTANYDGKNKNRCVIGNNCFIGCNVNLIAPIELGNNCFVAAGTTVTKNYSEGSFIIGRAKDEKLIR